VIVMAEDYSLFDYPAESEPVVKREWKPLWKPKDGKPESKAFVVSGAPAPLGSCEFVLEPLFAGSSGRKCRFGGCCFLFANPATYTSCPSRTEKLSELKKSKRQT
jgi:hypothetical protein